MNILITGATGLVGRALAARLGERGHRVVPLRRAPAPRGGEPTWDPERGRVDLDPAGPLEAVVHLAGETVAQRWTPAAKARIRSSRVDATRRLSEALAALASPPRVLVAASATGFYGDRGDEVLDEQSAPGRGFLPELCQAWESATAPARDRGIRVVRLRLGIVLTRDGGALARMLPLFRWSLGGRVGSGRQYWSWITLEDLLRILELVLEAARLNGALNAVAPEPATNAGFTAALSRALHRPAFLPVPAVAARLALGEMGREMLLASARVRPARLLEAGFDFLHPDLDSAFRHVLSRT